METPEIIQIQPGQPGEGMAYNVNKPKPYPFHIDPKTGNVGRQDFWKGDPLRLLGFQDTAEVQRVTMFLEAFVADPPAAIGKFPVFIKKGGGIYSSIEPITEVTVA